MNHRQLLFLTTTAIAGTVLSATSAQALTFSYNAGNSGAGTFSYDITLDAGETLNLNDPLDLTGLGGVTAVNSITNTDLKFSNSFDSISANFLTTDAATGAQTFTNAVILTSSNPLGTINYSGSSTAGTFAGTTQGPVTAVPFEPEANVGIFTILSIIGFNHYRKKLKSTK